jgi:hypothetical protein
MNLSGLVLRWVGGDLLNYLFHRFAGLLAQNLIVNDHDGGERTGAEAGD